MPGPEDRPMSISKPIVATLCAAFLLSLLVVPAAAQPTRRAAALGIEVRQGRRPMPDVEVRMESEGPMRMQAPEPAVTDAEGRAELWWLSPGIWRLDLVIDGEVAYFLTVRVEPGRKAREMGSPARDADAPDLRWKFYEPKGPPPQPPAPPPLPEPQAEPAPEPAPTAPPATAEPAPSMPQPEEQPQPQAAPEPAPEEMPEPTPESPGTMPEAAPEPPAAPETTEPTPEPAPQAMPEPETPDTMPEAPEPRPPAPPAEQPPPSAETPPPAAPPEPAPAAEPAAQEPPPAPMPVPGVVPEEPEAAQAEAQGEIAEERPAPVPEAPPVEEPAPSPEPQMKPEPMQPQELKEPPFTEEEPPAEPETAEQPERFSTPTPAGAETPPPVRPRTAPGQRPEVAPMPEPPAEPAPEAEPPAPDTAPAAAPSAPAPRPAAPEGASFDVRSGAEGDCPECKREETAVVVARTVPGGAGECPPAPLAAARSAAGRLAARADGLGAGMPLQGADLASYTDADSACQVFGVVLPPGVRYRGYTYAVEDGAGEGGPCWIGRGCPLAGTAWTGRPVIEELPGGARLIYGQFRNASSVPLRASLTVFYVP